MIAEWIGWTRGITLLKERGQTQKRVSLGGAVVAGDQAVPPCRCVVVGDERVQVLYDALHPALEFLERLLEPRVADQLMNTFMLPPNDLPRHASSHGLSRVPDLPTE